MGPVARFGLHAVLGRLLPIMPIVLLSGSIGNADGASETHSEFPAASPTATAPSTTLVYPTTWSNVQVSFSWIDITTTTATPVTVLAPTGGHLWAWSRWLPHGALATTTAQVRTLVDRLVAPEDARLRLAHGRSHVRTRAS